MDHSTNYVWQSSERPSQRGQVYLDTTGIVPLRFDRQSGRYSLPNSNNDVPFRMSSSMEQAGRRTFQSFDASGLPSYLQSSLPQRTRPQPTSRASFDCRLVALPQSGYGLDHANANAFNHRRASVALQPGSHSTAQQSRVTHDMIDRAASQGSQFAAQYHEEQTCPLDQLNARLNISDSPVSSREQSFMPTYTLREYPYSLVASGSSYHRTSTSNTKTPSLSNASNHYIPSTPTLSRSTRTSASSNWASDPATPTLYAAGGAAQGEFGPVLPSTFAESLISNQGCPGAPPMTGSRSYSLASLDSSAEQFDLSSSKLAAPSTPDGRGRSNSTSAMRNSIRSRPRTSDPPLVVSSADKPHVCYCGRRFKRMEHLRRHSQVHTQERPHKCPDETCGKFFGRLDNLAQHVKTHSKPAADLALRSPRGVTQIGGIFTYQSADMQSPDSHKVEPHLASRDSAEQNDSTLSPVVFGQSTYYLN